MSRFRWIGIVSFAWSIAVAPAWAQHYQRTDLTANASVASGTMVNIDPDLVNAWGLSRGSGTPWWISDNGTGLSTLYNAVGAKQSLVVTIPAPPGQNGTSAPTGTVFNSTTAFLAGPGAPSVFLFCTEDGTIAGWSPLVNRNRAVILVNRSGKAIYKGCAIAQTKWGPRFYATNFKTGRVEVFNAAMHRIFLKDDPFLEGQLGDYAPFGIQNVGGNIICTFAKREPGATDELHGAGLGRVAVFDVNGRKLRGLEHGPWMNAPWGIALAPGDFGAFAHRLLIGNFGSGTIESFNFLTGEHEGSLLSTTGARLRIDGLWALSFAGDSSNNGLATELYFTAGPNDEHDGRFGKITPVAAEKRGNAE